MDSDENINEENTITIGNRIPYEYFITSGIGETNITTHTGRSFIPKKKYGTAIVAIVFTSYIYPKI